MPCERFEEGSANVEAEWDPVSFVEFQDSKEARLRRGGPDNPGYSNPVIIAIRDHVLVCMVDYCKSSDLALNRYGCVHHWPFTSANMCFQLDRIILTLRRWLT